MSFPTVIRGDQGDEFVQTTDQRHPFGTLMVYTDGRKFRYVSAGELLVVGESLQSSALIGNQDMATATGVANARIISCTTDGTEAANLYKEGYIWINSGTNLGRIYQIESHAVLTGGAGDEFTIVDEDGPTAGATVAADDTASIVLNPYKNVITTPVTTETGACVGIAVEDIASASFGWIQTGGVAAPTLNAADIEGTAIAGTPGSAGRAELVGTDIEPMIGRVLVGPNAGGDAGCVILSLD